MSFEKFHIQKQESGVPEKIYKKSLFPEEREHIDTIAEKTFLDHTNLLEERIEHGENPADVYEELDDADMITQVLQDRFDNLKMKSNIPNDYQHILKKFEDQKNKEIQDLLEKRDTLLQKQKNAQTALDEITIEEELHEVDKQLLLLDNKYNPNLQ